MSLPNRRTFSLSLLWLTVFVAIAAFWYLRGHTRLGNPDLRSAEARAAAPEFRAPLLAGGDWRLSEHKGRPVLINFFATWCPPCNLEMPGLVKLEKEYQTKGVDFVAVSLDESGPEGVRRFAERYKIGFPVVFPAGDSSILSGISSIPVTMLIDRNGRVANTYVGMISEGIVREDLNALLRE